MDNINKLVSKSIENEEIAVAKFLDIDGIYNNVTTNLIIEPLWRNGVTLKIQQWIRRSLSNISKTFCHGGESV